MKDGNILSISKPAWRMPLRVLSLLTFFIGAFSLVQSVLMLMSYCQQDNLSLPVVIVFLAVTPLTFGASLFFALGIHWMASGKGGDLQIILGFAMMILASVDGLIYVSVRHEGDSISFYLLAGIQILCFAICFLYYQDFGTFSLTLCGVILLAACAVLEMEEAARYLASVQVIEMTDLYYFVKNVLNTLIAAESVVFLFGLHKGIRVKESKN